MTVSQLLRFTFMPVLLLLALNGASQNIQTEKLNDEKILLAAREIMTTINTCALISLDGEGRPRVRMMDPFDPESDFSVWFGTNQASRKVDQIRNDPRVTLYYASKDDSGYVMIHGTAQLIDDKKLKKKWWKKEWSAFYPEKRENYMLIKVSPDWMEVVSYKHGLLGDTINWEPPQRSFRIEN